MVSKEGGDTNFKEPYTSHRLLSVCCFLNVLCPECYHYHVNLHSNTKYFHELFFFIKCSLLVTLLGIALVDSGSEATETVISMITFHRKNVN